MQDRLSQRGINYLLHFTKYSNLPGIMENGLLRRSELDSRGFVYAFNDEMRLDGHPNSLSASIGFPNYRMFYRARQKYPHDTWVVLVLRPNILIEKPCAFYPMNAATGCYTGIDPASLQTVEALDAMFGDVNGVERNTLNIPDNFTTDPQAEILVFADIEPLYIGGVATQNSAQEQEVRQAYPHFGDGNVRHYPSLFRWRKDFQHWQ